VNIRDQKAQQVKTTAQSWRDIHVGDTVIITISPDYGEAKGQVREIELQADGSYPIFTVGVPAYGIFTRRADDCKRKITIILHMDLQATESAAEVATDIARSDSVRNFGDVMDWETSRE